MENKIWYFYENLISSPLTRDVLHIKAYNFDEFTPYVEATIKSFTNSVEWLDMWTLDIANDRVNDGQELFIGYDREGALAHLWFEKNYLYNVFVNPRRPDGYSKDFVTKCIQATNHRRIRLYCDEWNIKAQKLFEKVGFLKESTYI